MKVNKDAEFMCKWQGGVGEEGGAGGRRGWGGGRGGGGRRGWGGRAGEEGLGRREVGACPPLHIGKPRPVLCIRV